MTSPADRSYIKDHDWVQVGADGIATFGITDYAQDSLGDVVFVELPEPGSEVTQSEYLRRGRVGKGRIRPDRARERHRSRAQRGCGGRS